MAAPSATADMPTKAIGSIVPTPIDERLKRIAVKRRAQQLNVVARRMSRHRVFPIEKRIPSRL